MIFQNILFLKKFIACNDCIRFFYQNKKGACDYAFGAHFLHDFSIKMFLI